MTVELNHLRHYVSGDDRKKKNAVKAHLRFLFRGHICHGSAYYDRNITATALRMLNKYTGHHAIYDIIQFTQY